MVLISLTKPSKKYHTLKYLIFSNAKQIKKTKPEYICGSMGKLQTHVTTMLITYCRCFYSPCFFRKSFCLCCQWRTDMEVLSNPIILYTVTQCDTVSVDHNHSCQPLVSRAKEKRSSTNLLCVYKLGFDNSRLSFPSVSQLKCKSEYLKY